MKHLPPIKVRSVAPATSNPPPHAHLVLRVGPKNAPARPAFHAPRPLQEVQKEAEKIVLRPDAAPVRTVTGNVITMPVVQKLPPVTARTTTRRHRDAPVFIDRPPQIVGDANRVKREETTVNSNYRRPQNAETTVGNEQFTPYRSYDASLLSSWQSTEQVKFWWAVGERHAQKQNAVNRDLTDDERNVNIEAEIAAWRKAVA